ncbi:MAG: hypothetical protein KJ737_10970 [Proteobacteria bacterium]|nr:hypothetical protein [Pseudomonadota bacterium]
MTNLHLKDVIQRAEKNGDYYMVSELIESGFDLFMKRGRVAGYNYEDFMAYIDDAYEAYLNYRKLTEKMIGLNE